MKAHLVVALATILSLCLGCESDRRHGSGSSYEEQDGVGSNSEADGESGGDSFASGDTIASPEASGSDVASPCTANPVVNGNDWTCNTGYKKIIAECNRYDVGAGFIPAANAQVVEERHFIGAKTAENIVECTR